MRAGASIARTIGSGDAAIVRSSMSIGSMPRHSRSGFPGKPGKPIGFPPRPSGNMPPAAEPKLPTGGAARSARAMPIACNAIPEVLDERSEVGSYEPNAFGLYDTAGNAAEWVEDCWNADYRGAPRNGLARETGQCRLRVLRGGAFDSSSTYLRSASRFRYDMDVRYVANGFRVLRVLP